jgi:hypothetical protein
MLINRNHYLFRLGYTLNNLAGSGRFSLGRMYAILKSLNGHEKALLLLDQELE